MTTPKGVTPKGVANEGAMINADVLRKVRELHEAALKDPPPAIYMNGRWHIIASKILFLDIDGVLITAGSKVCRSHKMRKADPGCVAQLNRVIRETGARVVVSSSWRLDPEVYRHLKAWGVEAEFVGKTPSLGTDRGLEIAAWLSAHKRGGNPAPRRLVILDDYNDMWPYRDFQVRTDFREGLTKTKADAAIRMLNG